MALRMNPSIGPVRRPSIVALEGLAIYVAIVVAALVAGHDLGTRRCSPASATSPPCGRGHRPRSVPTS